MDSNNKNEITIKSKVYECKNFTYPYIQINNYGNESKYSLNFLNKNKKPIKIQEYEKNIPRCLQKLFKLDINEKNKGLITEITCINSYTI